MYFNLIIANIDVHYCNYLKKFDFRVPYNNSKNNLRPFVGVLFNIGDKEYFAPLSSPKSKHLKMKNTVDFIKIKNGEYGAINFNNMIPVKKDNYTIINLNKKCNSKEEEMYQELLINQYTWININMRSIKNKAAVLYKLYNENRLPDNIKNRCCNYLLLEEKCEEYKNTMTNV